MQIYKMKNQQRTHAPQFHCPKVHQLTRPHPSVLYALLCALWLGILRLDTEPPRFPLWFSSVFTLSRMRSVPIIVIDSTASHIPGSCSLIYTFTLLQPEALLTLISCNDFNKAFL